MEMLTPKVIILLVSVYFPKLSISIRPHHPEQVHISLNHVNDIVVTWSTMHDTKESIVEYGIGNKNLTAKGGSTLFVDGGSKRRSQYIHRVTLPNLMAGQTYVYHCGSSLGWSPEFWFKTFPTGSDWSPRLAIYGDLGLVNAQSLPRLQKEAQRGMYDAVLHVGDFAYDLDSNNARIGDTFMRKIEPIAAHVPYMVCPGNHEERYNFSNYKARFSMPGGTDNMMYSFNIGPLHIISISIEVYYFLWYGIKSVALQYEWLENELIRANLPENWEKHPWIIVMGHRPMYCSTTHHHDCTRHETRTRVGLSHLHVFGLEKLLYDYGVDVEIWAHEHAYQRLWPVYDYKVYNGSYEAPYVNPGAPVHFFAGSAGCEERVVFFNRTRPPWSAFQSSDYGYTRLHAYNATHLHFEQVSDDKSGAIIDSFWIVKDKHGPYPYSDNN